MQTNNLQTRESLYYSTILSSAANIYDELL
jgi:hypothetical protein